MCLKSQYCSTTIILNARLVHCCWTRYRRRSLSASSFIVVLILVAIGDIRGAVCSKAAGGRVCGGRHGHCRYLCVFVALSFHTSSVWIWRAKFLSCFGMCHQSPHPNTRKKSVQTFGGAYLQAYTVLTLSSLIFSGFGWAVAELW